MHIPIYYILHFASSYPWALASRATPANIVVFTTDLLREKSPYRRVRFISQKYTPKVCSATRTCLLSYVYAQMAGDMKFDFWVLTKVPDLRYTHVRHPFSFQCEIKPLRRLLKIRRLLRIVCNIFSPFFFNPQPKLFIIFTFIKIHLRYYMQGHIRSLSGWDKRAYWFTGVATIELSEPSTVSKNNYNRLKFTSRKPLGYIREALLHFLLPLTYKSILYALFFFGYSKSHLG